MTLNDQRGCACVSAVVSTRAPLATMGHPSTEDPLIAERSITFELRLMEAMGIAPDDRGAQMAWAERYAVQVRSLLDDDQSLRALIRDERYADAIAHARPLLEECTT